MDDVFNLIGDKCVLVESEEPICRDIVRGCENSNINSKISCESPGAVIDDYNKVLECLWLEGNSSSEMNMKGICKPIVYYYFYYFIYFIFFFNFFFLLLFIFITFYYLFILFVFIIYLYYLFLLILFLFATFFGYYY
jgi:hypothetical protein